MTSLAQGAVLARRRFSWCRGDAFAMGVVLVLGAALRFWGLGHQSFWFDEIATTQVIKGSFWHVFSVVETNESTPPLYYVLAWVWTRASGINEVGLRSLSAVLGVATILFTWTGAREAVSARAGVMAATVVAVNPMLLWYSQEARAYALLAFFGSVSFWLFARAWHEPTRGSLRAWSLVCCLALVTHYFAVFVVAAELLVLLWLLPERRREVGLAFVPVVLVGMALIPLAHAQEAHGRTAWIAGSPIGGRLGDALRELVTANTGLISSNSAAPGGPWGVIGAIGVLLGMGIVMATPQARRSRGVQFAAIVGGLGIVIPLVLCATPLDYFKDRNLIAAWVPLAAALGCGLALARPKLLAATALAAIAVAGGGVVVAVERTPRLQRTDWRGASRSLGQPVLARAVIIKPGYAAVALSFYGQSLTTMPIGAKVREIDIVGEGVEIHQTAPPGFVATLRKALPGLTVLRFDAAQPITITRTVIALAGGSVLLELSDTGRWWIEKYFADLAAWKHALSNIENNRSARTVLANAPAAVNSLAVLPPEIPTAAQLLSRLREIARLAGDTAVRPDASARSTLHLALTGK